MERAKQLITTVQMALAVGDIEAAHEAIRAYMMDSEPWSAGSCGFEG